MSSEQFVVYSETEVTELMWSHWLHRVQQSAPNSKYRRTFQLIAREFRDGERGVSSLLLLYSDNEIELPRGTHPQNFMKTVFDVGEKGHLLEVTWRGEKVPVAEPKFRRIHERPDKSQDPGEVSYEEYLKSDHWRRLSRAMKKQAGGKCQLCGRSNRELHVHHNNYDSLGSESSEDLICLCEKCHQKVHDELEMIQ